MVCFPLFGTRPGWKIDDCGRGSEWTDATLGGMPVELPVEALVKVPAEVLV